MQSVVPVTDRTGKRLLLSMVEANKQVAQLRVDGFEPKAPAVDVVALLAERYTRGEVDFQNLAKARGEFAPEKGKAGAVQAYLQGRCECILM